MSLLPCLGLLAACAAPPEEGAATGYVLIDGTARASGYALDHATGPLPTAIEGEAQVAGPAGAFAIEVPAGAIAYVHGDEGAIDLLEPGVDIDPDRVRATGTEAAARTLADALGAAITADGDGAWILRADGVVAQLAAITAPAGLDEVALIPLEVHGASANVAMRGAPAAMPVVVPAAPMLPATAPAELAARAGQAALEAATLGVGCDDPIAGRWIGQSYTPESGGWHEFTLTIARRGEALTGAIDARYWPGDATASGASVDAAGIDRAHHHRMVGRGAITARGVAFKAVRFADDSGDDGYALDAFTGALDRARSRLAVVNNDGAVAFDRAYAFRRIACE